MDCPTVLGLIIVARHRVAVKVRSSWYNEIDRMLRISAMETRLHVLVLSFLTAAPAVPCSEQSLADSARQERAKRQSKKAPSKVFTNDDLSRYETSEEPSSQKAAEASPAEASAPSGRAEGPSPNDNDERAWS